MASKKGLLSLFKPQPLTKRKREGRKGEEMARRFFASNGYRIIAQNYRTKFGEIDLICEKGSTLIFVEVRRKTGREFGEPQESIRPDKVLKIRRSALQFLSERGIQNKEIRFDLFLMKGKAIELIPNAF